MGVDATGQDVAICRVDHPARLDGFSGVDESSDAFASDGYIGANHTVGRDHVALAHQQVKRWHVDPAGTPPFNQAPAPPMVLCAQKSALGPRPKGVVMQGDCRPWS